MLGPSGPRRLRLAVEHLAQHRGGICFCVDLDPRWVVKLLKKGKTEEAKAYADKIGALFFETSAKTNVNVHDVFVEISQRLPPPEEPAFGDLADVHLDPKDNAIKRKGGCCS